MTTNVNNEEKWLPCIEPGFEHYLVSDQGRVMNSKTGQIVKPYAKNRYQDYLKYTLWSGGMYKHFYAHRLVYEAWHRKKVEYPMQVDHIDNNPKNNRLDNLQLLTPKDNNCKKPRVAKRGEGRQRNCPKPERQVSEETKEKLRAKSNAYWEARKAALIEP